MSTTADRMPDHPGWYEIRLRGHLDQRWATWFDGMTLTAGDGTTRLQGRVVDQAALHGLLNRLRDTGLPLVSVTHIEHRTGAGSDAAPPPPIPSSEPGA